MNEIRELTSEEMATLEGGFTFACALCPNSSLDDALAVETAKWVQSVESRLY